MPPLPLTDTWLVLKLGNPVHFEWRGRKFSVERTTSNIYRVFTTGGLAVSLCRKMSPSKNPPRWWFISVKTPRGLSSRYQHRDFGVNSVMTEVPDDVFKSIRAAIAGAAEHLCGLVVDASLTSQDPGATVLD